MIALALALALSARAPADSFPHASHRRVFASCTTCHAGIVSGDSATTRPAATACATCHDGQRERRVDWAPAPPRPTNLRFDHRAHARDSALACTTCHATQNATAFMDVARARPERCLTCHEPRAPSHFAAENCATCHRRLRDATRLAPAGIARLPRPASHDSGWVFTHKSEARSATCAFCHTRESCAACHVNAGRVDAITALGGDPRVADVVAQRPAPSYPRPASHAGAAFGSTHGRLAAQPGATCANCHARESCIGCHRAAERVGAIAALPARSPEAAAGVFVRAARPADHVAGFALRHREAAAAGERTCASCHAQRFCASCHDAAGTPVFHARNYVARHGADAFATQAECATCHQPQAFCVSCHRETGRASQTGAPAGAYHDRQPRWRLGAHGAAARRSIESCASCHRQNDCLQCHSARGGQGVSPHGPGFDPSLASKNRQLCLRCHVNVPGQ